MHVLNLIWAWEMERFGFSLSSIEILKIGIMISHKFEIIYPFG